MSHQIRFFSCDEIYAEIESEARRLGANLVMSHSKERSAIQLSRSSGTDTQQGRLWTDAVELAHYDALCSAVKRSATFDRESGLWVKRVSRAVFESYRDERKRSLAELAERNQKYAIEVLGGRPLA